MNTFATDFCMTVNLFTLIMVINGDNDNDNDDDDDDVVIVLTYCIFQEIMFCLSWALGRSETSNLPVALSGLQWDCKACAHTPGNCTKTIINLDCLLFCYSVFKIYLSNTTITDHNIVTFYQIQSDISDGSSIYIYHYCYIEQTSALCNNTMILL